MTDKTEQPNKNEADASIEKRNSKALDVTLTFILILLIAILCASVIVRCFVGCKISVSGESMLPNFQSGEKVWVNKNKQPVRGDIVVIYKNDVSNLFLAEFSIGSKNQQGGEYEKLIKRVVAVAGDKIWVEEKDDDYVLVIKTKDNEIIYESYTNLDGSAAKFFYKPGPNKTDNKLGETPYLGNPKMLSECTEKKPFEVPVGHFFFLGDNRYNSIDSRDLGAFPLTRLYGVVTQHL